MSCNCNHPIPCDDPIDPMGGATLPEGYVAEVVWIDGQPVWGTNPPLPPGETVLLLVNQNGGGILIDEGLFLAL